MLMQKAEGIANDRGHTPTIQLIMSDDLTQKIVTWAAGTADDDARQILTELLVRCAGVPRGRA